MTRKAPYKSTNHRFRRDFRRRARWHGGIALAPDSRIGTRKTMIVALARKLVIALWRFVTTGETLDGVILRPAG